MYRALTASGRVVQGRVLAGLRNQRQPRIRGVGTAGEGDASSPDDARPWTVGRLLRGRRGTRASAALRNLAVEAGTMARREPPAGHASVLSHRPARRSPRPV